jgi:CheY-like chemotaxis protein
MSDLKSILIVDDEPTNLDILVAILKEKYKVKAATSGEKALKVATKSLPDLVLLDVIMPEMNGLETCRRLLEISASLPVVLITGNTSEEDIAKGKAAGAKEVLAKPVDSEKLRSVIENFI